MGSNSVKDFVLYALGEQPSISNDELAALARESIPGSTTTAASVSSIKSGLRKAGLLDEASLRSENPPQASTPEDIPEDNGETDEEIGKRLSKRFDALDRMASGVIKGIVPALIVSGPAGLGKSYGIEKALEAHAAEHPDDFKYDVINGSISAVGLYIALYRMKDGGVVVLDDADDVFRDETALNILKAALDSGSRRMISWRKQAHWLEAEEVEDRFEFNGRVIFLTNIDFEQQIEANRASSVHFRALMDRSLYLHLTLRTMKDYIVRIRQVVLGAKMLDKYGMDEEQVAEILEYVEENKRRFYHLSLRLVHQIALCHIADPENWRDDIEMTKMKVG